MIKSLSELTIYLVASALLFLATFLLMELLTKPEDQSYRSVVKDFFKTIIQSTKKT